MMFLCEIKVKSAHSKKCLVHNTKIVAADPEKSAFKQNILLMKADFANKIENIRTSNSFESHCFNVLS